MPQKTTHRQAPGGFTRHARTVSGGSSKMNLNLHFTQKDSAPPKHQEKLKKNGHVHDVCHPYYHHLRIQSCSSMRFYYVHQPRAAAPLQRVNSGIRAPSKEYAQPMVTQKRPQVSQNKHPVAKQKTGFTISSPGEDEDEWVSSEAGSGAVTPDDSSDDEGSRERSRTPVETVKPTPAAADKDEVPLPATPRAEFSMSRVATARPAAPLEGEMHPFIKCVPQKSSNLHSATQLSHQRHHTDPDVMGSRSGTTSPTHHSHRHDSSKRNSFTRPPSMYSVRSETPLRPHPLIRGNSYGQGIALGTNSKPAPLAPLTVTSGSSAAQISSSPPNMSTSPTSVQTAFGPQSPNRRTSISSARSVATLPVTPPMPSHDRHRTISSSSTASFAALTSLVHYPTAASRPPTPQYTAYFPSANTHGNLDAMHPLLPPPYLGTHLAVLTNRSPIRESFDRVVRAKQGR
jgi:hypothetical protein